MKNTKTIEWLKAALLRAARTFAQTAAASLGVATAFGDVCWGEVFSAASLAAVISLLMSVGGLPEVKESD